MQKNLLDKEKVFVVNEISKFFNDEYKKHKYVYGQEYSDIVLQIRSILAKEESPPSNILEIGGGYGRDAKALKRHFPQCDVLVYDISSEAIRLGTEWSGDEIKFKEADIIQTQLEKNSYDVVFSYQFLHLVESKGSILSDLLDKVAGSLKKGGWMFHMYLPNPDCERAIIRNYPCYKHDNSKIKEVLESSFHPADIKMVRVFEAHHATEHTHNMCFMCGKKNS